MIKTFTVSIEAAAQWAEILEDGNPLHADATALEARGLGRGIVMPGPANMGYLMTLLMQEFPAAHIEEFQARFTGLVLAPSTVEAHLHVYREESTPNGRRLHCKLELQSQSQVAVRASACVHVPTRIGDGASC